MIYIKEKKKKVKYSICTGLKNKHLLPPSTFRSNKA